MKEIIKTFWFIATFILLLMRRWIEFRILPASSITILLFHDVRKSQELKFAALLKTLNKFGDFITLEDFESMVKKCHRPDRPLFLVTFDDGFVSSGDFAENHLNPMGIKAVFFVCPGFIGAPKNASDEFIVNNLFSGEYDKKKISEAQSPMNQKQIESLLKNSHSIGSHSFNHRKLSALNDTTALQEEIQISKKYLEDNFEVPVNSFAYPFGDIYSVSTKALQHIQANYSLNFTGIRGRYKPEKDNPMAIWRQSINLDDSFNYCLFCALGGLDPFYTSVKKKYEALIG